MSVLGRQFEVWLQYGIDMKHATHEFKRYTNNLMPHLKMFNKYTDKAIGGDDELDDVLSNISASYSDIIQKLLEMPHSDIVRVSKLIDKINREKQ